MEMTICELFAGVGGFRLGLERASKKWKTTWFSQWEPSRAVQWAHKCYVEHWGDIDNNTNVDISKINKRDIPNHNLLVGGFPCQDYSVARSISGERGIQGKKGVLWWQIYEILKIKKPPFCLFENVDRLLKSPAKQRGRDFAIMLACFAKLNYSVEWRVINASDYGAPQKRKRTFIFAYKNNTKFAKVASKMNSEDIVLKTGFFATTFPVLNNISKFSSTLLNYKDIISVSKKFMFKFENTGYMKKGHIYTAATIPVSEKLRTLGSVLEKKVSDDFYIKNKEINNWKYLKGKKRITRKNKSGHSYLYSEGSIAFPDDVKKPARTILTSEGTKNRSSHIIYDKSKRRYRTITPLEAERLQCFDDNWTANMPLRARYFCMGNALVVSLIEKMGKNLEKIFRNEK